jgi:hypothetical protein
MGVNVLLVGVGVSGLSVFLDNYPVETLLYFKTEAKLYIISNLKQSRI